MLNVILYAVLRLAGWLLPFVPATTMYRLAKCAGWFAFYCVRGAREGVTGNLAVALGKTTRSPAVRAAAKSAFQNDAMNWVDTLRIGRMSQDEIQAAVHVEGWEVLEEAVRGGRGSVMVTLHLGNFDLVGQVLAAHGYRLTVPVEQMYPRALFDFLVQRRIRNGIKLVPVEHAARGLMRALRAGELVGLAGDRNVSGKTISVPVFGRPASLPIGPVSLARHTGCPLLFAVGVREGAGRFRGIIRSVPLVNSGDAAADDVSNLLSFVELMEEVVLMYPGQWLAFSPFWQMGTGENTAATMGHQKRAAV